MTPPAVTLEGHKMGKKVRLLIPSAIITIFFLALSIYQLSKVFTGSVIGNELTAAQISGWTALILFLLGASSLIFILRSHSVDL
ncbi:hypothetical protein KDH_52690 [Dictyobacter sp. S3.2.2.5]|uniref:Uncharacterized protein n=1 Tax=Dictyobacter halimunensis TaxID=3026934 RepID=A0ABQ6FXN3_9CHLR|nr:hypothetical protein KDH_52690 [Dictyobacter sp. S3.2.2.5]